MTAGSGEALRQQLEEALHRELVDHGFDRYPDFSPAFRAAVWPLIDAALAAERAEGEAREEKALAEVERVTEWADRLAYAIGGDEIGEHSNLNDPWANAIELSAAKVAAARVATATEIAEAIEARKFKAVRDAYDGGWNDALTHAQAIAAGGSVPAPKGDQ